MNLFATDKEVVQLEIQLSNALVSNRIHLQMQLAWALRQRDYARTQQLSNTIYEQLNEIEANINNTNAPVRLPLETIKSYRTRLTLIKAEYLWLTLDINRAEQSALEAIMAFGDNQDWLGCADAHWLLFWIYKDCGTLEQQNYHLDKMIDAAIEGRDIVRSDIGNALSASRTVALSSKKIDRDLKDYLESIASDNESVSAMWANEFFATIEYRKNNPNQALLYLAKAYKNGIESGQLHFAIVIANWAAKIFKEHNEFNNAIDWLQNTLDFSRQLNWPRAIAVCLINMAQSLRAIKDTVKAITLTDEALTFLAPLQHTPIYAAAIALRADLALESEQYQVAEALFGTLQELATMYELAELNVDALKGQSQALMHLGKPQKAFELAQNALVSSQQSELNKRQIELLITIAEMVNSHAQLADKIDASTLIEDYLKHALKLNAITPNKATEIRLYQLLASQYERQQNYLEAYAMSAKALEIKKFEQSNNTILQTDSIKLFQQIDPVGKENKRLKQQALQESARVEDLFNLTATLQKLGEIGQEITLHLTHEGIFSAMQKYVTLFAHVDSFGIFMFDESTQKLVWKLSTEENFIPDQYQFDINDPKIRSCQCFREQKEIERNNLPNDVVYYLPGTLPTLTSWYFPISTGSKKLGVMTVQSTTSNAFSKNDVLVFRNLSAFAAIGIENANNYAQLKNTRDQLVHREKLAALGSIVAGVAHELNTPIGNGLLLATSLGEKSVEINQKIASNAIKRTELSNYLTECQEASTLIVRSLQTAADLVMSFKQVSIDQTSEKQRPFNLKKLIEDVVATVKKQFIQKNISIDLDGVASLDMTSFPGPLGRVIMNLMQNALVHAFENRAKGCIKIECRLQENDRIELIFSDDGNGIAADHLDKIFNPFFTTKLGTGGSGLGLNISYNIIKTMLQGDIRVESQVNVGTTFTLDLPRVVV